MGSPCDSSLQKQQVKYIRARDNPFFDGMRRNDNSMINSTSQLAIQKIPCAASDIGESSRDVPSQLCIDFEDSNEVEDRDSQCDLKLLAIGKSYSIRKRKLNLSGISLPPSAASFYNGCSPQMDVESCASIRRLNLYLKSSRDAVNAGVPGRFLRAVLAHDASDVGSFISTVMYSFYLNETQKSSPFCTVPVINIRRSDLNSHAELKWLLDSCNVDQSSLLFIDEVDLSYYDLFGSLKLILLNADKLPEKQESLKDSLFEIFNSKKSGLCHSSAGTVTDKQECSCCALIAEMFVSTSPEILIGKGFSRLLLAGILMDTGNLTNPQCTSIDRYMSTLLINGAGRFGCNGLYQILRYKMHDVSDLNVGEILRKDYRKWTRTGKPDSSFGLIVSHVGMSSIGISIAQLLSHAETATQEIIHFQQLEKLRLLMIVSGYYDPQKNFKREILISAESADLVEDLLDFIDSHASRLPLKNLYQPGLNDEMRAFTIDKVASRRTMEQLLEDFGGTPKTSLESIRYS